jgi:hypothetical protein
MIPPDLLPENSIKMTHNHNVPSAVDQLVTDITGPVATVFRIASQPHYLTTKG